ncbi:unnamed protein product [Ilex paraguariensis]|uniref:Uncharacterized protein n=1 Tax=Ilex paraguariensis TaxID=185542 RepID=A0ABC8UUT8_9AQUA
MMKTVSGEVVYTKPTSLSKAAKILINFVSFDNGVPYNVSAYLSRALVSFNELVQFHKELKAKPSDRKHKKHRVSNLNDVNPIKISKNSWVAEQERVEDAEDWWKHKNYRKPRKIEQNPDEVEADGVIDVEDSVKHKKYENPVMFQKYPDEAEEERVIDGDFVFE